VRARRRAVDQTHQRISGAFAEDQRASLRRKRKPGQGVQRPMGGFRINVGANKDRSPRKDVSMSLQNKLNKRRGRRAHITGAKKWHRSRAGQDLHNQLGRLNSEGEEHDAALRGKIMSVKDRILAYNAGATRKIGAAIVHEDFGTLRPRSQGGQNTNQMTSRGPQGIENPTQEDHLEAILRKLIVSQDMDVLQDVEFDEDTGSLYLFFDPVLMPDEVEEILASIRQERGEIQLIASPDMSIPGESVESEWWVVFLPGPDLTEPDPSIYAKDSENYGTRITAVVKSAPSPPEAVSQGIDVNKLMKSAGS
jgi:hypothetical protein